MQLWADVDLLFKITLSKLSKLSGYVLLKILEYYNAVWLIIKKRYHMYKIQKFKNIIYLQYKSWKIGQ